MPLPDLIEIVPLDKPVYAEITVPGSKSITNRALVLAALADGEVTLEGALWSEDTQVMVDCLQRLGFEVRVEPDPNEFCNRTITVRGRGGEISKAGTAEKPLELFVGNAGTAARFLSALVCLGRGVYRLSGVARMHERPQAALFQALRELGYRVDSTNDKLPAVIHGAGPACRELATPGPNLPVANRQHVAKSRVSIKESSQFASALLLCAERGGWQVEVTGENAEESPYVLMTTEMMKVFPKRGGKFLIEPDASSGSYFWAAGWLSSVPKISEKRTATGVTFSIPEGIEHRIRVSGELPKKLPTIVEGRLAETRLELKTVKVLSWPSATWQIDSNFPRFLPGPSLTSRRTDLGDGIMTLIVVCADQDGGRDWDIQPNKIEARGDLRRQIHFTDLGRLRLQECERVVALRTELTKCGAKVIETRDTLEVFPSKLHGAEIETYNDHRMAMCFAVLGLKVPGIKLRNPSCVKKTFPNFFQKLAAAPPQGLGVKILDGHTGRELTRDELFAE